MTELMKVNYDNDRPTVSGRELHKALEVNTPYHKWFPRMTEYGFSEGQDFTVLDGQKSPTNNPKNPWVTVTDHQLTIDMAKELCMIQRTDKGKECRAYFLEVEKRWNSPGAVMARALQFANNQLEQVKGQVKALQAQNSALTVDKAIMQPKADYFDELVDRNLLTNFRETAKQLGIKQKDFISFLLEHKYVYRDKRGKLMPYAGKNDGLFEVKECINEKTDWSGTQTLITPKGRETFRLLCIHVN